MCPQKMRNRGHPYIGKTAKFGRDRDTCSEIDDITVPYYNFSQSIKDSWFVSFSVHVPTKNATSLTPSFGGQQNLGKIGTGATR